MSSYRYLSHPLGPATPVYGRNTPVVFRPDADYEMGDSFSQTSFETINHNGTHVDGPYHFNPFGARISELPASTWRFENPTVVSIPASDDEVISPDRFLPFRTAVADCDSLLVVTGHGSLRSTAPDRYTRSNPGLGPDVADFLLATAPRLRGFFIDIISCAAASDPEPGFAFHQRMLGQARDDRFVLLFEDADLAGPLGGLRSIWALPLVLDGLDGAPVTIVGEFDQV